MRQKIITYLIFYLTVLTSAAENITFEMSAPSAVETGQQFRLTFSLNSRGSNLQLPSGLTDNFDVLMGPSTSQSTSMQMINGQTVTEVSFSYTFILRAKKEGVFEIRPGAIEVEGKVIQSNSLKIQVVKSRQQGTSSRQPQGEGSTSETAPLTSEGDNLFVRVELDKRDVYRGEQIIATVKLYADPNIPVSGFEEVNLPTYEGFYTQDIDITKQINFTREVYNDRIYQVGVLKKTVLFPQQNGTITIKPFDMTLLVQQRVRPRSFFDDFYSGVQTSRAKIVSKSVSVNIRDLPSQPASFYGGVGNFNLNSDISSTEVTTNDAVTIKIIISGSGNLRLIRNPVLNLPGDFEIYDPRATENIRATEAGVSGTKTIEYLFQPRFEGDYTIPAVSFTFFNPAIGEYVTRNSNEFTLRVEKSSEDGQGTLISSHRREDLKIIGQDIRFIRQGNPALRPANVTFYGTPIFYAIFGGTALLFLIFAFLYRKRVKESSNVALMRNKKANRIATKRLKNAYSYMKQNDNEKFHEEILKAFWGYLSDKLGIPQAQLNRETAVATLHDRRADDEAVQTLEEVIDSCEFARFAPDSKAEARGELYKKALNTMSRLEKSIRTVILIVTWFTLFGLYSKSGEVTAAVVSTIEVENSASMEAGNQTSSKEGRGDGRFQVEGSIDIIDDEKRAIELWEEGNSNYMAGEYHQAIISYEQILSMGLASAKLYFNLGNAFYKRGDINSAILNYERAHLLAPDDEDIAFNLTLAGQSVVTNIEELPQPFFLRWRTRIINLYPVDSWGVISIISFLLFLGLLGVFLFSNSSIIKRAVFWFGILMFFNAVASFSFAARQKERLNQRRESIIFCPRVTVKSTPSESGTDLFLLYEGVKVSVTDSVYKWKEIRLPDGNMGWMPDSCLVKI